MGHNLRDGERTGGKAFYPKSPRRGRRGRTGDGRKLGGRTVDFLHVVVILCRFSVVLGWLYVVDPQLSCDDRMCFVGMYAYACAGARTKKGVKGKGGGGSAYPKHGFAWLVGT